MFAKTHCSAVFPMVGVTQIYILFTNTTRNPKNPKKFHLMLGARRLSQPISCFTDTVLSISFVRPVWQISDNHSLNIQGAWTIINWEWTIFKSDRAHTNGSNTPAPLPPEQSGGLPKPLWGRSALGEEEDELLSSLSISLIVQWPERHTCPAHVSMHQRNDWIQSAVQTVWIGLSCLASLPTPSFSFSFYWTVPSQNTAKIQLVKTERSLNYNFNSLCWTST